MELLDQALAVLFVLQLLGLEFFHCRVKQQLHVLKDRHSSLLLERSLQVLEFCDADFLVVDLRDHAVEVFQSVLEAAQKKVRALDAVFFFDLNLPVDDAPVLVEEPEGVELAQDLHASLHLALVGALEHHVLAQHLQHRVLALLPVDARYDLDHEPHGLAYVVDASFDEYLGLRQLFVSDLHQVIDLLLH